MSRVFDILIVLLICFAITSILIGLKKNIEMIKTQQYLQTLTLQKIVAIDECITQHEVQND